MPKREFHRHLEETLADLPRELLKVYLEAKMRDADIEPEADLLAELSDRIVIGQLEDLTCGEGDDVRELKLDAEEFTAFANEVLEEQVPEIVENVSHSVGREIAKAWWADWPDQNAHEELVRREFRNHIADCWGEPINRLRMLLTICRDIGGEESRKASRSKAKRNRLRREVLLLLHARACRVTEEIVTLLEAGLPDGAFARWRTMHEIHVVAALIAETGDELAQRYIDHDVVEAKRALDEYLRAYEKLGYRAPAKREARRTQKTFEAAIKRYGKPFSSTYGWAADLLDLKNPTFRDLEEAAEHAMMRAHYKGASQFVHGGIRGLDTLALLPDSDPRVVLTGASDVGFEEPGQNAAITLGKITFLLLWRKNFDFDQLILMRALMETKSETVEAFARCFKRLKRERKNRLNSTD